MAKSTLVGFQALMENARDLVYVLDAEGMIRYASPNVRQVLGYDPEGYARETLYALDFVHPEDRAYAEAALEDLLRHPGKTREFRLRLLDAWGRVRKVRVWGRNLLEDPAVRGIVINVHDETELEEERARLKSVLEALPGVVYQARVEEGQDPAYAPLIYAAPRQTRGVLGYPAEALLEDPAFFFSKVHPEDRPRLEEAVRRAVAHPGEVQIATYRFLHGQKGAYVWLRDTVVYDPETRLLTGYTYDVSEEVARERALRESEALFRTLAETAPALILLWQAEDPKDPTSAHLAFVNQEALRLTGYSLEELKARPIWEFVHPQDREVVRARGLARLKGEAPPTRYAFRILTKEGEVRWLDYSAARVEVQGRPAVLGVGLDITEAKERERTLEAFAQVALALRQSENLKEMMESALDAALRITEAGAGALLLYEEDPPRLTEEAARGFIRRIPGAPRLEEKSLTGLALKGQVVLSPDLKNDPRLREAARPHIPEGWAGLAHPLLAGKNPVGVLLLAWPGGRLPTPPELERIQVLAETIGNAVRRAQLREKLAKRVAHLEALRQVDQAILASMDLAPSLEILLDKLFLLPLDAAAFFLYEPREKALRLAAHRGFRTPVPPQTLFLGQGHVGRAALTGEKVAVDDLRRKPGSHPEFTREEGLVAERAYPLLARGSLLGVLAVFTRRPWDLLGEDEAFLEALVGQSALALDSLRVLRDLQKSQRELEAAYELTLWGWAKAVELRDQETAGHTERVTALTLRLAEALGVPEEDLDDLRRGAILHDVGKIAIPDRILLKPGPLTEEEWAVMKLHPVYAYEWLSGIPFLKKALEVPYAHHERWDGSGYPRGLKGLEIPLSARIFAVADVYDALTSDRPYRKAWPKEKALAYIREEAGKQFDPEVVEAFLKLMAEEA
ncbi:putative PAS/PAC sensor protein [Thermus thermophilus SG0.5JP17-16]|uniref:Putative PAS/PAC sensor protein n=1 Tax=Thermus thermophilus (strain SG0.5JP17-16) TaxID=762633 RepID=F6DGR8_THETG|nr:HD domain-containing phosphohydrolase [Thermus thermophilus]AEG33426.1 putative PAS/PAC sensor protein [Thermus thermophilus SG0.5JP17-16]